MIIFKFVKDIIIHNLLESSHKDGDRLPSVRTLMSVLGASSATVQAALRILEKDGKIHCVQGKGCFWGSERVKVDIPLPRESAEERLERQFNEDFEKGFLSSARPLPMVKELQSRYQISPQMLRIFLMKKVQAGILKKDGRKFSFVKKDAARSKVPLTELLFITRCDAWGGFSAASEREMDFLRFVYRRAGSSRYKLILLGYDESNQRLLDRSGHECNVHEFPNAVGALVSTLLIEKPVDLLRILAKTELPISIWWEHPSESLSKFFLSKNQWMFFNSSFGIQPGVEMGKFLKRRGIESVVYFSPYHNSSWSKDRLTGLSQVGVQTVVSVDAEKASPWDFKLLAMKKVEKYAVDAYARELTKEKMLELVKAVPAKDIEKPWVCVNDEVANILIECAEGGNFPLSEDIFAFDNSAESYLLRFASFDFNTETLVEQMFYALECPSNFLGTKKIHQIRGSVVEK